MIWELDDTNRFLIARELSLVESEHVMSFFTRKSENARHDPRVKAGIWDGNITQYKKGRLPAGLWKELLDLCKRLDFKLHIIGIERLSDKSITDDEFIEWVNENWKDSPMKPYDFQITAAARLIRNKCCMAELATSAGKSLISFMVLSYLLTKKKVDKILFVVPTVGLVTQAINDFSEYNTSSVKLDLRMQECYSGSKTNGASNLVIGTYQSLSKKRIDWLEQFDMVIVDETHMAKNNSIRKILELCTNANRRIGLTGTVPDVESLDFFTIAANLGPVVLVITADELITGGYITNVNIYVLELDYADDQFKKTLSELYDISADDRKRVLTLEHNYAIQSKIRLDFIVNFILKNTKNSLVLFHRTEYGEALYNLARSLTDRELFYIDGSINKNVREELTSRMEHGEGKIMFASFGTFSTGINVRNLHAIYLTESFKSDVIVRQSIGRGLRKHNMKSILNVFDFTDDFRFGRYVNYLYRHSKERQAIYKKQKFNYVIKKISLEKESNIPVMQNKPLF